MSAGVQSYQYTVALTGKTFDVLSSMLYKDPILAIIRELSCNSMDSHITNGNSSQPFDIHLPNTIEPHFSIRDYGTGMSAEQINSVYTKFFESTKTTSNDVVGALGLGSKSPFSYTNNYTITSWCGGLKLVYSAFKGADGIPSIALLDVSDTTEPTGLEVSLAVKSIDFDKFTTKVQTFFTTWGSVPPNISGGREGRLTINQVKREFGQEDWFIATADGPLRSALAIQGNVPYPLQSSTITSSNAFAERVATDSERRLITYLLGLPIVIQFPIGTLDFSASREELQYTEQTVGVILDRLKVVASGLAAHVQTTVNQCATQWEVVRYSRILSSDRLRNIVALSHTGKLNWKGTQIGISTSHVEVDMKKAAAALALHPLTLQSNNRRKLDPIRFTTIKYTAPPTAAPGAAPVAGNSPSVITELLKEAVDILPGTGQWTLVIIDEPRATAKLKHHYLHQITSKSIGDVFTLGAPRGEKIKDRVKFNQAIDQMLIALDVVGSSVNVIRASALSAPPKQSRAAPSVKIDDTFKLFDPSINWTKAKSGASSTGWTIASVADIQSHATTAKYDAVVYVPIIRGKPVRLSNNATSSISWDNLHVGDFKDSWKDLLKVFENNRILLVGIKAAAMQTTKAKAFINSHNSLESHLRLWMVSHATKLLQTHAYHSEWMTRGADRNVLFTAYSDWNTTDESIASIVTMISKFKCDKQTSASAMGCQESIMSILRILQTCDRADGVVDDVLSNIAITCDSMQSEAKQEYAKLVALVAFLTAKYPMLDYVQQKFDRYTTTNDLRIACAHIRHYITIVSTLNQPTKD